MPFFARAIPTKEVRKAEDQSESGRSKVKARAADLVFRLFGLAFVALVYTDNLLTQQFLGDGIEIAFGIKVTSPLDYTCVDQTFVGGDGAYGEWLIAKAEVGKVLNSIVFIFAFAMIPFACCVLPCLIASCGMKATIPLMWFQSATATTAFVLQVVSVVYDAVYLGPVLARIAEPQNITVEFTGGVSASNLAEGAVAAAAYGANEHADVEIDGEAVDMISTTASELVANMTNDAAVSVTVTLSEFTIDAGCGAVATSSLVIAILAIFIPLLNAALKHSGCKRQCKEGDDSVDAADVVENFLNTFVPCLMVRKIEALTGAAPMQELAALGEMDDTASAIEIHPKEEEEEEEKEKATEPVVLSFDVGSRIQTIWKGDGGGASDGKWYGGTIVAVNGVDMQFDGFDTFGIKYDDGDFQSGVPTNRLRHQDVASRPSAIKYDDDEQREQRDRELRQQMKEFRAEQERLEMMQDD